MLFSTVGPSFGRLLLFEDSCPVFEPVALSCEFNDFAFVEQPITVILDSWHTHAWDSGFDDLISRPLVNRSGKRKHLDKSPLLILYDAAGDEAQRV